eukprot:m.93596 g.93596  ORF g.93596 m.93596 type:complete len:62 (+) comp12391_c0_seq2:3-188(+)
MIYILNTECVCACLCVCDDMNPGQGCGLHSKKCHGEDKQEAAHKGIILKELYEDDDANRSQ